jgi:hypothetical protein
MQWSKLVNSMTFNWKFLSFELADNGTMVPADAFPSAEVPFTFAYWCEGFRPSHHLCEQLMVWGLEPSALHIVMPCCCPSNSFSAWTCTKPDKWWLLQYSTTVPVSSVWNCLWHFLHSLHSALFHVVAHTSTILSHAQMYLLFHEWPCVSLALWFILLCSVYSEASK